MSQIVSLVDKIETRDKVSYWGWSNEFPRPRDGLIFHPLQYGVIMALVIVMELGVAIAWSVDRGQILMEFGKVINEARPFYDYVETIVDRNNRIVPVPGQTFNNRTASATMLINIFQTWVSTVLDIQVIRQYGHVINCSIARQK